MPSSPEWQSCASLFLVGSPAEPFPYGRPRLYGSLGGASTDVRNGGTKVIFGPFGPSSALAPIADGGQFHSITSSARPMKRRQEGNAKRLVGIAKPCFGCMHRRAAVTTAASAAERNQVTVTEYLIGCAVPRPCRAHAHVPDRNARHHQRLAQTSPLHTN